MAEIGAPARKFANCRDDCGPSPGGGWILIGKRPPALDDGGSPFYDYRHKRSRAGACFTIETAFTDGKPRKHLSLRGHSETARPIYLKQFGLSADAPIAFDGMGTATHFYDPPLPRDYEEPSFVAQAKETMESFLKKLYRPKPGPKPGTES